MNQSITIDISISLNCESGAVIDASDLDTGINIHAENVTVDGCEIVGNSQTTSGVAVGPGSSNVIISNNKICHREFKIKC